MAGPETNGEHSLPDNLSLRKEYDPVIEDYRAEIDSGELDYFSEVCKVYRALSDPNNNEQARVALSRFHALVELGLTKEHLGAKGQLTDTEEQLLHYFERRIPELAKMRIPDRM